MSTSYQPLTSLETAMDLDENVVVAPSGSNTNDTAQTPPQPPKVHKEFGKPSELPATKAMKTLIKNSVAKYQRLQDRLLKYTQHLDQEREDFADEAHMKAVKKFYQFRLVDIQRIRKDTLSGLDRAIALTVLKFLIQDVQKDIDDIEPLTHSTPMRKKLQEELKEYANNALNNSLVANDPDIQMYKNWWISQINYNCELLRAFCLKTIAGATGQVRNFLNSMIEVILNVKDSFNTSNIFDESNFLATPTGEEGSGSREPQLSQKKGRS